MSTSNKITWLAVAGFLAFSGCANSSGNGTQAPTDAACATECETALDVCSRDCQSQVDNNLCAQECIDEVRKCKRRCE